MTNAKQQSSPAVPKHVQAANASWLAPLIAIVMNVTVGMNAVDRSVTIAVGALAGVIIVAGLIFAVWAMIGAFKKGPLRILFPAFIGLLINGFLVYLAGENILHVRQVTQERRAQHAAEASDDWIPTEDGWHIDRSVHFAVQFPEDWEVIPNPQERVAVMALSPLESAEDAFRENRTIVTGRVPPRTAPKTFLANDLDNLRRNTAGFVEYGAGIKTLNGSEWSWIDYRLFVQGIESRAIGYMTIRNGRAFVVTCVGDPDRIHEFKELFDRSIESFRTP